MDPKAAEEAVREALGAMLGELILRHPSGDVTALAVAVGRYVDPVGAEGFGYWIMHQDNLDAMAADTVALQAIPDFIAKLNLPVSLRAEMCRRIMFGEAPLK